MKVFVYPADETGCGYYRLIWPATALKLAGADVTVVLKSEVNNHFQGKVLNNKMFDVVVPDGTDVIVLQRPTHEMLQQAVPLLRKKGIAVVIDMDDDLQSIDPRNPAFQILHPNAKSEHSWQHALPACDLATLVTVSTPALLDVYARRARGVVLPNYVPRSYTQLPHEDSAVVGWGGSLHSHPDDLQAMGPAISRLTRSLETFTVVGPEKGVAEMFGETIASRIVATGAVDFLKWSSALANNLGIGVAPTADTKFNRAKSWLKPLEYAAVGIPPISSRRDEYERLHELGIGWIAWSPKDWYRSVMRLVNNEALRREVSAEWRAIVAEKLTVEVNAHRWWETWQLALDIQRKRAH